MAADRGASNRLRWMIAGTVLAGGTASAAYLHQQGPSGAPLPDVRPLRALAQRIDQAPVAPSGMTSVPTFAGPSSSSPRAARHATSRSADAHATETARDQSGAQEPQTAPVLSPVKTLALIGVTIVGNKEAAWLVDLESHDRFTANEGDDVEGLHVRDIQPDHVILTQNGTDYELRLGEKSAELAAAEPVEVAAATTDDQQNQNRRRGGGGRNWGGRNGGGGRQNSGYSGGGNRFAGNSGGFRRPTFGGFRGGGGGFNGGSSGGNTSQRRVTHPTSNPQEARRKGVRLVGNVTSSIPQPTAFFNPQTVRRVGSATGHAFGADNSNNRRAINAADPSRSTSAVR